MNRIEEKYGLKKNQAIALFVILVLNILWIVCSVSARVRMFGSLTLSQIANFAMFAVTAYYACYSYKKPHGNLMRYILLCYAAYSAIRNITSYLEYPAYIAISSYLAIILTSYMAGRLDHYKQNIIISAAVLVCKCLMVFYLINRFVISGRTLTFDYIITTIGPVTLWLAIATSYIIRYKPHKEAGLENK